MKDNLYEWLFHYNIYEELWYAFKREDVVKHFNGELNSNEFHKAKNIMDLVKFITKQSKE